MPHFTVTLTAYCTVTISAENDEEAGMLAMNETPISSFSIESGDQIAEIPEDEVEWHKNNSDYVID